MSGWRGAAETMASSAATSPSSSSARSASIASPRSGQGSEGSRAASARKRAAAAAGSPRPSQSSKPEGPEAGGGRDAGRHEREQQEPGGASNGPHGFLPSAWTSRTWRSSARSSPERNSRKAG